MATLSALKFTEADWADRMISRLEELQKVQKMQVIRAEDAEDAAVVRVP